MSNQKIDYEPLYYFARDKNISYNELCTAVRAAVAAGAQAALAAYAQAQPAAATHENPHYLAIERSQGIPALDSGPVPMLYSDSINHCMVRRDDVWLALTSHITQAQPAAPDGWKLVPIEANDDMLNAGKREAHGGNGARDKAKRMYRAMLAASPPPALQPEANTLDIDALWQEGMRMSANPPEPTPLPEQHRNGCYDRPPLVEEFQLTGGGMQKNAFSGGTCEYTKSVNGQKDLGCVGCKHKSITVTPLAG
jgi:NAD-dependent oxidoreductase involved in siderophore biosynthesis